MQRAFALLLHVQSLYSCLQVCNTLQHTHCNTLQHTATHCNTLQHTLQHVASHIAIRTAFARADSLLVPTGTQHTATHCRTLPHTAAHCNTHCSIVRQVARHTATHCNTLQKTLVLHLFLSAHVYRYATRYNTLQHATPHSNTQKHAATHYNTR